MPAATTNHFDFLIGLTNNSKKHEVITPNY